MNGDYYNCDNNFDYDEYDDDCKHFLSHKVMLGGI